MRLGLRLGLGLNPRIGIRRLGLGLNPRIEVQSQSADWNLKGKFPILQNVGLESGLECAELNLRIGIEIRIESADWDWNRD